MVTSAYCPTNLHLTETQPMTLLAYLTALALLVTAGCFVDGSGLYLADHCCPATRRGVPPSLPLRPRKTYGGAR